MQQQEMISQQEISKVSRTDDDHGHPPEHGIPMRRSPRARRSLSVADISPSHGCRGKLGQVLSPLHGSCSTLLFTTELRPRASDLLRRRTSEAPATEQLRTPPNTADQTGAHLGGQGGQGGQGETDQRCAASATPQASPCPHEERGGGE